MDTTQKCYTWYWMRDEENYFYFWGAGDKYLIRDKLQHLNSGAVLRTVDVPVVQTKH